MFIGFHVNPSKIIHVLGWILLAWWSIAVWSVGFSEGIKKMKHAGWVLLAISLILIAW